jgi:hypothetical protein
MMIVLGRNSVFLLQIPSLSLGARIPPRHKQALKYTSAPTTMVTERLTPSSVFLRKQRTIRRRFVMTGGIRVGGARSLSMR